MRWIWVKSLRYALSAMNAVKKSFKQLNFFHSLNATSRMRWKKRSPLKSQILQILTANFNAYLKFTGIIIQIGDRWRIEIRSCWHAGGERFEPVYGSFVFLKNPVNALKNFFSPLFAANLTLFFDQFWLWCAGGGYFWPKIHCRAP